jgi:2-iminobutanoate/2-iminopropanoate deaminase
VKEFRNPSNVHPPIAGFTHQVEITGRTRFLMLSGQIGRTAQGEVPTDPTEQLSIAFDNVDLNLQAAGMTTKDLVKLTIYLVGEMDASKRVNIINQKLGGHKPCMTLIYVAALANPAYKVELDAWASAE